MLTGLRFSLLVFFFASLALGRTARTPGCPSRSVLEEAKKDTVGYLAIGNGLCTGTLLSPHVVITAAHCVDKVPLEAMAFTLTVDHVDQRRGPFAPVADVVLFPKFARGKGDGYGGGDIALLRLGNKSYGKEPLAFYSPIDGNGDLVAGSTAYIVGYGLNVDSPGGIRRSRHVRFQSREPAHLSGIDVANGVFKFNRGDEGELPCGGDSGSPVLKFVGESTGIVAIHSASSAMNRRFADGRWEPKTPQQRCKISFETYATAVGPFLDWIQTVRQQLETEPIRCP